MRRDFGSSFDPLTRHQVRGLGAGAAEPLEVVSLTAVALNRTEEANPSTTYDLGTSYAGVEGRIYEDGATNVYEEHGWLHFDTALTSELGTYLMVPWRLRMARNTPSANPGAPLGPKDFDATGSLYLMETDWTPGSLTWNNEPSFDGKKAEHLLEATIEDNDGDEVYAEGVSVFNLTGTEVYGLAFEVATTISFDDSAQEVVWLELQEAPKLIRLESL